jgi:hypothetical protein
LIKKENNMTNLKYDGKCAFAVSLGKMDVPGGSSTLIKGDDSYAFSNPIAKLLFRLLPNRLKLADGNWDKKG